MYFLASMCLMCLKSKHDLNIIDIETLTKLLNCKEKTDEFITLISDQMKICKRCLSRLKAAFCFKEMCLRNIIHFKDYIVQLRETSTNSNAFNMIQVNLTDINSVQVKDKPANLPFKLNTDEHFERIFVKQEIFDETYIKTECIESDNIFDDGVCEEEWENQPEQTLALNNFNYHIINDEIEDLNSNTDAEIPTDKTPHFCYNCHECFTNKTALDNHMLTHVETTRHFCSKCGKSFLNLMVLKIHESKCIRDRPHSCLICGNRFTAKNNLNRHMMIHLNHRPYSCPICESRFTQKANLKRHIMRHKAKKPHCCSICGNRFNQKSKLQKHIQSHNKKQPRRHSKPQLHSCTICGSSFAKKISLCQHMLQHKKLSHSCSVCGKEFKHKGNINRHMLIHNNVRPFVCNVCGHKFTQKTNLTRHKLLHTGNRLY